MAQQESILKLKGRIGDLTFYKTKNGYQARQVTGVDADRIANDPKFERTRENNAEFGRGGQAAKQLRKVLRPMILLTYDPKMPSRLFSRMMRALRKDSVSARGERMIQAENLYIFRDFNFNIAAELGNVVFAKRSLTIDRASGSIQLDLPLIQAAGDIVAPQGATHFQLNLGAGTVDFESEEDDSTFEMTSSSTYGVKEEVPAAQLSLTLPADNPLPIFVLFGISFFQEVNGTQYPLNNGAYNAISIIRIDVA